MRHNSLIRLNLDGFLLNLPQLRGTEAVDSLDLSNKRLGFLSAIAIAFLVERNTALTNLNLLKNCFGTEAATQLAAILPQHKTLKTLCGFKPDQTDANLANQRASIIASIPKRQYTFSRPTVYSSLLTLGSMRY